MFFQFFQVHLSTTKVNPSIAVACFARWKPELVLAKFHQVSFGHESVVSGLNYRLWGGGYSFSISTAHRLVLPDDPELPIRRGQSSHPIKRHL